MPAILAAADSGRLTYGPNYSRRMAELVRDIGQADDESAVYWADRLARMLDR